MAHKQNVYLDFLGSLRKEIRGKTTKSIKKEYPYMTLWAKSVAEKELRLRGEL